METFLFNYRHVILEFLVELYTFYVLLTWNLKRESHFWLRAVPGLAAVLAIAAGTALLYPYLGYTAPGRIGLYLLLFAASLVQVWGCYNVSFPTILFCGSAAYAAQNLCYKLRLMFMDFWGNRLLGTWGGAWHQLLYLAVFAVLAAAVYFLFVRRVAKYLAQWQMDSQMLALLVLVLAVTVILCSVEDVYFDRIAVLPGLQAAYADYFVLRQTGNLFSVLCCAAVLVLACRMAEQRELRREVEFLQHTIRQGRRQYELARDTINMINVKCHDIRYRLALLNAREGGIGREAVEDLQKSISIYDAHIETGNQMLDVLLTEKSLYCEQHGITFTCMADGEKLAFLEDSDLYCLFGNIVDNALEAVRDLPERERRVVNLVVRGQGDLLMVQEDNYFAGTLAFADGLPVTTKADRASHGFGMRSIRMIAQKYGGVLSTSAEGNVFHLNILFGSAG